MNASFSAKLDDAFKSGGLLGLWEMLKIKGSALYSTVALLNHMDAVITQIGEDDSRKDRLNEIIAAKDRRVFLKLLNDSVEKLNVLDIRLSVITVSRAAKTLKSRQCTYNSFAKLITELKGRMRDELSATSLYVIDAKRAEYYEPKEPHFGVEVANRFPSANYEIEEAGKCLALRRSTACVTHLMRAVEPALNSLATALGVTFDRAGWNTILDQIDRAVRLIGSGEGPHAPDWKADQKFYSEAAAHLRLIKDAWRNHAMHLRDRYDEERAEAVFLNVRTVMRHVAIRLSEPEVG